MAGKCDLQQRITELSNLLQSEKDLRFREQLRNSEQEKVLRGEIRDLKEQLQRERNERADSFEFRLEALEKENMGLFSQKEQLQMNCKEYNWTYEDVSEKDESTEKFTVMQHQDENQEPNSLVQKENDVCTQNELMSSERDNVLQQYTWDLEETLQTEGSDCLDMLESIFEALEREDRVLISQQEELQTKCKDYNWIFKDVPDKDEAESAERVTVMQQEEELQEPESLVQKENDVCTQEKLKTSEQDNVLQQETCDLEECSECLDMLRRQLEPLESHNKVLSDVVEQLKMRFECMAEKYKAEKKEKEALQNIIQELNIKLQKEMDLHTQQQLKASEREKVLAQEIDDLRETLQKECDEDSKLQAWEKERKAYLLEIEDLKLCYEGKTLRFHDMFQKLKEERDHKEAIKEEQFKKIQALRIKVRQQEDLCIQQKVRASEKEKMLSLKLEELQEKISRYEKRRFNTEDEIVTDEGPEASGVQKKHKKRKGWKKVAYYIKPWHWGNKKKRR